MRQMNGLWRLWRGLLHLAWGWWLVRVRLPRLDAAARQAQIQGWAGRLLALWGIGLRVQGQPLAQAPVLLVANHVSWLDIVVLHAARFCRFVSKADVRRWPLIGTLADGAGTLYIERASRRDALRVVHQTAQALQAGQVVAVFPEGTTGDGRALLPFHANLLQAALVTGTPVQPVGLRFVERGTGQTSFAPSYTSDETLIGSVWRTLASDQPIDAVLTWGVPQQAQGRGRRAWADALRTDIDALRQGLAPDDGACL